MYATIMPLYESTPRNIVITRHCRAATRDTTRQVAFIIFDIRIGLRQHTPQHITLIHRIFTSHILAIIHTRIRRHHEYDAARDVSHVYTRRLATAACLEAMEKYVIAIRLPYLRFTSRRAGRHADEGHTAMTTEKRYRAT